MTIVSAAVVAETSVQETKHHARRVGELRFIMPAGPEALTLQTLSPEHRGYRAFIHGQARLSGFAGAGVIAKSRTRMSEISSSL